ncbi:MAG TPA: hypothetical protein VF077_12845 [Nitrospiraceae bacterium]
MWGQALSGWERERISGPDDLEVAGVVMGVEIPDWLPDAESRAKWLTLSLRDRSDWARAHGSAAAGAAGARAAEELGHKNEQVQALEEAYSSLRASIPASAPSPIPDRRWMLWAGGAVLVGYLVLRRGKKKKVARK